jgi:hypothetical protein
LRRETRAQVQSLPAHDERGLVVAALALAALALAL